MKIGFNRGFHINQNLSRATFKSFPVNRKKKTRINSFVAKKQEIMFKYFYFFFIITIVNYRPTSTKQKQEIRKRKEIYKRKKMRLKSSLALFFLRCQFAFANFWKSSAPGNSITSRACLIRFDWHRQVKWDPAASVRRERLETSE